MTIRSARIAYRTGFSNLLFYQVRIWLLLFVVTWFAVRDNYSKCKCVINQVGIAAMKMTYILEVRHSEFSEIFLRFLIISEECRKLSWIKSRSILSSTSL